jgi:hypothetical protein
MYLNGSVLTFNQTDINNIDGINAKLSTMSNITITDGITSTVVNITNYNISNNNINVTVSSPINLKLNTIYTLYPCTQNSLVIPSLYDVAVDNNIFSSILIFVWVVIGILVYLNWAYIYNFISSWFPSSNNNTSKSSSGGKIYYIGGYDYRDYSE